VVDWYDVRGMVLVSRSTLVTSRTFPGLIAFQNFKYVFFRACYSLTLSVFYFLSIASHVTLIVFCFKTTGM